MKYSVYMQFPEDNDDKWYIYGSYRDKNLANEVAMQVRDERNCWVKVVEEN